MNIESKAINAASALGNVAYHLAMASKFGEEWHIKQARESLQRALVELSDAPEPGTLSPINGGDE